MTVEKSLSGVGPLAGSSSVMRERGEIVRVTDEVSAAAAEEPEHHGRRVVAWD